MGLTRCASAVAACIFFGFPFVSGRISIQGHKRGIKYEESYQLYG
jgi:hypothetical protein